ncbi:MAG: family 10 glycosylhydrolase [Prolixibacteraceae bacterium]|nr:family 10 glycosylhydrolase [Prolixibacteraceae bacterium]
MKHWHLLIILLIGFQLHSEAKKTRHQTQNLLWFDATANFARFSNADSVKKYLDKCVKAGVTDAVIDVRPITGEVLFDSQIAPRMNEWQGANRDPKFDYLGCFIKEGHQRKIRIHASMNNFVGGHNFFDRGIVYSSHSSWQSINYTPEGIIPITQLKKKYSAMMNPANPEVRQYLISLWKELVGKYPKLDGVMLDRGRFDGIQADFSPLSREVFETYMGEKVTRFPEDIYEWGGAKEKPEIKEGKYFKKWLEWRSTIITNYFVELKGELKAVNPNIVYGDYTGAWYSSYYDVGVNWASKTYDPAADYSWATPEYKNTGYAEVLDLFTVGCYFTEISRKEVERLNEEKITRTEAGMRATKDPENTVEGSAELAMKVTKGVVPLYAGLYVDQYKEHPEQFVRAMKMCRKKTDGVMIFDVVHIINNSWWKELEEGIKGKIQTIDK